VTFSLRSFLATLHRPTKKVLGSIEEYLAEELRCIDIMKKIVIVLGVIAVYILYLAYSESNEIVINKNSEITGIIRKLQKYAQEDDFWKRQLVLVKHELRHEESFPIRMAELKGSLNKIVVEAQESIQKFNNKNPSLNLDLSEAQKQADALREKADNIEHREMDAIMEEMRLERIDWLKSVKAAIEKVLDSKST
jgi:hypothetical protein